MAAKLNGHATALVLTRRTSDDKKPLSIVRTAQFRVGGDMALGP
jgi:hypothetical protein